MASPPVWSFAAGRLPLPVDFGLSARKSPQLVTVVLADGAANELPALAILRDLVRPPDGMIAIIKQLQRMQFGRRSEPCGLRRHYVAAVRALRKSRPEVAAWLVNAHGEKPD